MSNEKKTKDYKHYESINLKDIGSYPIDTYVGSKKEPKNIGKTDEYNKDKEKQKSNSNFKSSSLSNIDKSIDNLIPDEVGNAIDGAFSTIDSLLNATSSLFFGKKQSKPSQPQIKQVKQAPKAQIEPVRPITKQKPAPQPQVTIQQVQYKQQPPPVQKQYVPQPQIKQAPQPQVQKVQYQAPVEEVKKHPKPKVSYEDTEKITRTTSISDLDLPLEFLNDQDLVRYFDQMKLYEKKVKGGLCSLTYIEATDKLKKGKWGKLFTIEYEKLNISIMMGNPEEGRIRFYGMIPVYKALARQFSDSAHLKKAIEDDINTYLKTGEGIPEFHKFTYKISRKKK